MISQTIFETRWGWMALSASEHGLTGIVLPKPSRREVERALKRAPDDVREAGVQMSRRWMETAREQIIDFLDGKRRSFDVPLDISTGTAFQRRVWRTLLRVPYGRLQSYQWVATHVGGSRYARAVGNAVGANPLPLVVPCHRIITTGRRLGGFSGGLHNKRRLLALEGTLRTVRDGAPRPAVGGRRRRAG